MRVKLQSKRRWSSLVAILAAASILIMESSTTSPYCCVAFVSSNYYYHRPQLENVMIRSNNGRYSPLFMTQDIHNDNNDDNEEEEDDDESNSNENPQHHHQQRQDTIPIPSLTYLTNRLRLEQAHTQSLLRRPPLKLPYTVSQKYMRHNFSHIKTKEQFEQLVQDGEIRNVYISKRPEEYYGRRGEWISWEHYLTGVVGDDVNGVGNDRNGTICLKWQ